MRQKLHSWWTAKVGFEPRSPWVWGTQPAPILALWLPDSPPAGLVPGRCEWEPWRERRELLNLGVQQAWPALDNRKAGT